MKCLLLAESLTKFFCNGARQHVYSVWSLCVLLPNSRQCMLHDPSSSENKMCTCILYDLPTVEMKCNDSAETTDKPPGRNEPKWTRKPSYRWQNQAMLLQASRGLTSKNSKSSTVFPTSRLLSAVTSFCLNDIQKVEIPKYTKSQAVARIADRTANKKAVLPQGNRAMPQVFFSVEVRQQHSFQV